MDYIDYFNELDKIFIGSLLKIYSFILFFFGFEPLNREGFFKSVGNAFRSAGNAISKGVRTVGNAVMSAADKFANFMKNTGKEIIRKIFKPLANAMKKLILKDLASIVTKPIKAIKKVYKKIKKGIKTAIDSLAQIPKHIASFFIRLGNFFKNLGVALANSIIIPIFVALSSFGTIFLGMFECLMVIIQKIIDIPKCILVWAYYGAKGFYNTVGKRVIPSWLRFLIETFISILKLAYSVFYYVVLYPMSLINQLITGQNPDKILDSYWEGNCMTISFKKPLNTMKNGVVGLIPKFKPISLTF